MTGGGEVSCPHILVTYKLVSLGNLLTATVPDWGQILAYSSVSDGSMLSYASLDAQVSAHSLSSIRYHFPGLGSGS